MGWPGFTLDAQPVEPPEELEYLIVWHADIRNRAARGQYFEPILLSEIAAYEHFLSKVGVEMSAFDWEMIFRLDSIWMAAQPKPGDDSGKNKLTRH